MPAPGIKVLFYLKLAIIAAGLVFTAPLVKGQNAPVTTITTVGNVSPGQVAVPITVTGFNGIGAISLSLDFATAGLQYVQGNPSPLLPGFAIGNNDLGNGKHRIIMGWFGTGTSLPDGSVIMTITFNHINGITPLQFYDNGPSCEYADTDYNVLNDIPQSTYYIDGYICGGIPSPGPINGSASVCPAQAGVSYSVAPLQNATGYQWTVPPGATIITGNNTNAITVDYSLSALSGLVTVNGLNVCGNGTQSQLAVTVNPLPVANAGSDVTIPYGTSTTLHAAPGGAGVFSYHWSPESLLVNPDLQDPQTVNLTVTEIFTVLVTNQASQCQNTDDVVVTITGGPLIANPLANPNIICKGTPAQLFANAGGGSGTYTYSWTANPSGSPPWSSSLADPVVFPDVTTTYLLTLNDGFNTTTGSVTVTVNPLPTAYIQGGDTLCGSGNSTYLTVDLTGTPPWSFYYSNGLSTWYVPSQYTTPYQIIANDPGIYTILAVTDANCTGTTSGSAAVAVFPVPPTPTIYVNGSELSSSGCCGNQWYKNGIPLPGATNQNYTPLQTAHYFTIVTVDGCSSDTSNSIYYFMAGIENKPHLTFTPEPNPAKNFVTLKHKDPSIIVMEIMIFDLNSRLRKQYIPDTQIGCGGLLIRLDNLSPGIYYLVVVTDGGVGRVKLVVSGE